jgi:addiction module HigA family antidote
MITKNEKEIIGWESPTAIHPGEFLEEILEEYSMSQIELSERIDITPKVINEIIKGKNPITRQTAFKLNKVFPMSIDYWVNLQQSYENDNARIEEKKRLEKEAVTYLPKFQETYKELAGLNLTYGVSGLRWVKQNFNQITLELQKFFATDSLLYVEEGIKDFAFRKYDRKNLNSYSLSAWLRIGEIKAQKTEVAIYSEKKLKDSLDILKKLSKEDIKDYLPKVEKILASCGVVVAYMPHIKNTHTQGASKWITPTKVLLMLNAHKRDEGKFWFNLFHEIGHILLHSKKECFIDFDGVNPSEIEMQADGFAQKQLILDFDKTLEEFNKNFRKSHDLMSSMKSCADMNNVSSAIVAGRFTNHFRDDSQIYPLMSKFLQNKIEYTNV